MFLDALRLVYALDADGVDQSVVKILKRLEVQINGKLDAMKKRAVYTQSKTGATEEEREAAQREYLELAETHKDWQY